MNFCNYVPKPPRVWSRVQNQCTFIVPNSNYQNAYIPLTNETVSQAEANYYEKLLYKGNILQYKDNSAKFSKKIKYSQLAHGFGPSRTKVFATQSQTYSNPNTKGYQRVNSVFYPFPNQIVGAPNNISGPFQYDVPSPFNCSNNTVKDGGILICGTYQNQCTGNILRNARKSYPCFPNYCSDVPGKPIELCWNPKVQTWFPKSRLTMSNSGTKWPVGYKGFINAEISEISDSTGIQAENSIDTSFSNSLIMESKSLTSLINKVTQDIQDIQVTQDSQEIQTMEESNNRENFPVLLSNNVSLNEVKFPKSPTLTIQVNEDGFSAYLLWTDVNNLEFPISNYIIYKNGIQMDKVSNSIFSYKIYLINQSENYFITALNEKTESKPSNIINSPSFCFPNIKY